LSLASDGLLPLPFGCCCLPTSPLVGVGAGAGADVVDATGAGVGAVGDVVDSTGAVVDDGRLMGT